MNTPIVAWTDNRLHFQVEAFKPFAYVTFPVTAFVLIIWGTWQWYERKKEKQHEQEHENLINQPDQPNA